jgi:hypothetical protein
VHLAGSSDRWYWSMYLELPVDFCVRALRHDGLHVTPFDQHPDGVGSLREKGLGAASWLTWVTAVLDHHSRLQGLTNSEDFSQIDGQQLSDVFDAFSRPAGLCPGSAELRARLDALWAAYERTGQHWSRRLSRRHDALLQQQTPAEGRRLWDALVPYHQRLPTLKVYVVDYPAPAVLTFPPVTCVIAPETAESEGAYERQVLAAAKRLSEA